MKRIFRGFRFGEKGFTLIELLVVVAIVDTLVAMTIPNVGKFIDRGKTESYETELHNIQTAVMAMLAGSTTGVISPPAVQPTADMDLVVTTDTMPMVLSDYVTRLNVEVL